MKKVIMPILVSLACLLICCALLMSQISQDAPIFITLPFDIGLNRLAFILLLIFGMQWLAFVPAYLMQTEKFYDLIGSITYISAISFSLIVSPQRSIGQLLIGAAVILWACRLGLFLFIRVHQTGGDSRFDQIKPNGLRFFSVWNIQGMWVYVTAMAVITAINNNLVTPFNTTEQTLLIVGLALWLFGFIIEVVSDSQKNSFRKTNAQGQFIQHGLWAWSRHPNYFGECLLWLGLAIACLPFLNGWQHMTMISPIFVFLLLTKLSGIPILEAKSNAKWGDDEAYKNYVTNTPLLMMKPPVKKND